ncbi:MAG: response regulator [Myxococcales bacterium]|nr:response regulator [Myxococcales bacterium]
MPMMLVARDGVIRMANEATCTLAELPQAQLIGSSVDQLVPAAARAAHSRWRADYLEAPERRPMGSGRDLALTRADGSTVPVEIGLNPLQVEGERFVLCSIIDLRERQRAERDRAQLEIEAAEADRLRSLKLMAGGVAHDFNNMLVSVLGNASLLAGALDPESELCEWAQDIEQAATQAAELAKQMLAFSGGGQFVVEPTDLNALIRGFLPLIKTLVPRSVMLRTRLAEDLPPVPVDRGQIRQILTNLVSNAADAMKGEGSIVLRTSTITIVPELFEQGIWLGDRLTGTCVGIDVSDDGPGIPPDSLRKIFEPFYTTRKEGHGMGLAAVLGIVKAHGGCISVYSELGQGTTFKVFLPVREVGHDGPAEADERDVSSAQPLVLVIDDEDAVRRFAARALARGGYRAELAGDPRDGIEIFRTLHQQIALVLLDLSMPHLNGREVYRVLQRIDPDVPVVVMSGFSQEEITLRFAGRRIGVLQKPFTTKVLLETVASAMS